MAFTYSPTLLDGIYIRSGSIPTTAHILGGGMVSSSTQINTGSFSGSFFGIATSASFASISLFVLQDNFTGSFTGSFTGNGSNLVFTTLNTNDVADSVLIVGNIYNNYSNKQTTVFRNGDVVVSGSIAVSDEGLLLLTPRQTPATTVSGALFYSSSGELYLGS